jgi:predicted RNase H-like HicB family nuclease
MQVVALIHEGNGEFAAVFPDFPGLIAVGGSMDGVIAKAGRLLAAEVEGMVEDGLELPPVRSLSTLTNDPLFREESAGALVALVPCTASAGMIRVSVALERTLLGEVDRAAREAGETRSKFLAEAVRRRLAADRAGASGAAAPDPPPAASPAEVQEMMESIRRSLAVIDATAASRVAAK